MSDWPRQVEVRFRAIRRLHLHDTRGLGVATVYAARQMGVDLFGASVAGHGGCCRHSVRELAGRS